MAVEMLRGPDHIARRIVGSAITCGCYHGCAALDAAVGVWNLGDHQLQENRMKIAERAAAAPDAIQTDEYIDRRERVLKALKGAAAVVFAGDGSPPLLGRWQAEHHFVYLTGIENEAGA